jgi:SSS family transporter
MYCVFSEPLKVRSFLPFSFVLWLLGMSFFCAAQALANDDVTMHWSPQTAPKQAIARHAPFVGVHDDAFILAGGISPANTNADVPTYLESIWVARKDPDNPESLSWKQATIELPSPRAKGTSANFSDGTVFIGGTDGLQTFSDVLLLRSTNSFELSMTPLPSLPIPLAEGSAAFVGNILYVLVTKTNVSLTPILYSLDLNTTSAISLDEATDVNRSSTRSSLGWQKITSRPPITLLVSQNDGRTDSLFALEVPSTQTSSDNKIALWQYRPNNIKQSWAPKASFNTKLHSLNNGSSSAHKLGQAHFLLFATNESKTEVMSYNAITNAWALYENVNSQSTPMPSEKKLVVLPWDGKTLVHQFAQDGRNGGLWVASVEVTGGVFGWLNMTVLIIYLLAMVMIGVYFVFKNKNVNDYFRGGQHIPWWANACSMYATILSSLTFVGMPSIVYRTDWVYWLGIWTILAVTPIAAYVAMPFFRRIDATSAYEYLSLRFNMSVRLFASGLFTLFHISRMGIVMALTALAFAAVTPFEAWQCVLIIGVLSLIYCTLGGIEAVIWTDTIQTIVLLLGALLCFAFIVNGVDGGITEIFRSGVENDKFKMVNIDFSMDSFTKLSIWVIVLGGIGQNLSTFTADQSIVQRYMTTKDVKSARKSIWTNGIMSPIASAIFFAIGTGLYVFYQNSPEKLDPTIQLDQILPTFISNELPIGIAGIIIAGIFAAAQSTVSTSMNSISTTLVTDFMRPFNLCHSERSYLNAARMITLLVGIVGTTVGLLFISPEIRSLMEEYWKVVAIFMGALGGLFILGMVSTKANASGATIGALFGVGAMLSVWILELTEGIIFATIGIVSSVVVGYLASALFSNRPTKDLTGLTIHTIR